jgi:membrane protein implicated in regulation of membrane protease activity
MAAVMHTIYMVCLLVGVAFSLLSLLAGNLLDGLDFDLDFDFDFGFDFGLGAILPLKPFTVMAFIAVFGGAGLILETLLAPLFCLLLSSAAGFAVAAALYRFVYLKLKSFETTAPREADALLLRARVVEAIPPGGFGKISYTLEGNILSGAAKERKPGPGIAKGAEVFIVLIQDNIHYVCEDLQFFAAK